MKLYKHIRIDLYNTLPMPMLDAQQNNIGRGVEITLTADSEIVDPSDEEVKMYCKNPDGTRSYLACSVVNGNIRAEFTSQMLEVPGILQVELQMISGTDEITTPIFTLKVNPSNIDSEAIESQNEFTALQQALSEVAYLKVNGLKGDKGEAATVRVGTVTASDPEGNPSVVNSGTNSNAVFDFVLPRGKEGPKGDKGDPGDVTNATNPIGTLETDIGKVADAYYTYLGLKKIAESFRVITIPMSDFVNDNAMGQWYKSVEVPYPDGFNESNTFAGYMFDSYMGSIYGKEEWDHSIGLQENCIFIQFTGVSGVTMPSFDAVKVVLIKNVEL